MTAHQPLDPTKRYLIAEQASAHAGIPHGAFLAMVKRGEVPHHPSSSGVAMFLADELDVWVAAKGAQ